MSHVHKPKLYTIYQYPYNPGTLGHIETPIATFDCMTRWQAVKEAMKILAEREVAMGDLVRMDPGRPKWMHTVFQECRNLLPWNKPASSPKAEFDPCMRSAYHNDILYEVMPNRIGPNSGWSVFVDGCELITDKAPDRNAGMVIAEHVAMKKAYFSSKDVAIRPMGVYNDANETGANEGTTKDVAVGDVGSEVNGQQQEIPMAKSKSSVATPPPAAKGETKGKPKDAETTETKKKGPPKSPNAATDAEVAALVAGTLNPRTGVKIDPEEYGKKDDEGRPAGRPLGKTTGLPILLVWGYAFQENSKTEAKSRVKTLGHQPDEAITAFMQSEFPGRDTPAFLHPVSCRRDFNSGKFTKNAIPSWQSTRYDETGNPVAASVRTPRAPGEKKEKKDGGIKTVAGTQPPKANANKGRVVNVG